MMKTILSLFLLMVFFAGIRADETVYRCGFTPGELDGWTMADFASVKKEDGRRFLRISVPEARKKGKHFIWRRFDLTGLRGKYLTLSCWIRADRVSKPAAYFNGIKVMLQFRSGGEMNYFNLMRLWGDFDWKKFTLIVPVPDDAPADAELSLGLQDSSGTVDFADLDIVAAGVGQFYPPLPLPENFKAEYTPRVSSVSVRRGMMSPTVYRRGDIDVLAGWGANLLRWQLMRNWGRVGTERDKEEYSRWIDSKLDELDAVLADCDRLGVKLVLDLHTPPGGLDSDSEMTMFHEPEYAKQFIEIWERIARRLKGRNRMIFGYNLINEPKQWRPAAVDYLKLQYDAALAIRAIDPDIPIIVESNRSAAPGTFSYLCPLPIKDVIYQVHMYRPHNFTHQNVSGRKNPPVAYPGRIDGIDCDREELRRVLQPVRDFQLKYGARIYVGEFSAARWAPGAAAYLDDCAAIFEEYGWDWSYHAFRESPTWDVEWEGGPGEKIRAVAPTDRQQVLLKYFRKNEPAR